MASFELLLDHASLMNVKKQLTRDLWRHEQAGAPRHSVTNQQSQTYHNEILPENDENLPGAGVNLYRPSTHHTKPQPSRSNRSGSVSARSRPCVKPNTAPATHRRWKPCPVSHWQQTVVQCVCVDTTKKREQPSSPKLARAMSVKEVASGSKSFVRDRHQHTGAWFSQQSEDDGLDCGSPFFCPIEPTFS